MPYLRLIALFGLLVSLSASCSLMNGGDGSDETVSIAKINTRKGDIAIWLYEATPKSGCTKPHQSTGRTS
jgi:hypothetical protein